MKSHSECISSTAFIRARNFPDVLLQKGGNIRIINVCLGTEVSSDLLWPLCRMVA